MPKPPSDRDEPKPLEGPILFEESDFRALVPPLAANPDYNAHRLAARRKLLALGKRAVVAAGALGLALECRTSLHNPHQFNGNRVTRLWAYLTRAKKDKSALKRQLGPELGKDLDSAYRNAYLCVGLEGAALEVSLRIHPDGWYDGQNLVNRVKREGVKPWLAELNALSGFRLRLHDWKGEFRCGTLTPEKLEEFLKYYTPGDHQLAVEKRYPAPEGARGGVFEPGCAEELQRELLRLVPVFRFTAWSQESDYLLSR
ncbi:MAG: hypothetical protein EXS08_10480 [Planctomycetes bacterium]|nr:hypothetical protein [Planctomycetota bacterium]